MEKLTDEMVSEMITLCTQAERLGIAHLSVEPGAMVALVEEIKELRRATKEPIADNNNEKVWVILARAEKEYVVARERRTDLGERPEMRARLVGRACVWKQHGTETDMKKAAEFAAREGYSVFTYPRTERDPLGRAKKDVLAQ